MRLFIAINFNEKPNLVCFLQDKSDFCQGWGGKVSPVGLGKENYRMSLLLRAFL